MDKIIDFESLPHLLKTLKERNSPVVLVGGCFDILHLGHIRFLKEAKKHGTLIVALESDETLVKFKGKSRPIHRQLERAEVLAALVVIDHVILLPEFKSDADYLHLTQLISPDIIAITQGDPQLPNKQKQAERIGARIVLVPKITTPSTTQLAKLLALET